jgi:hypothetical protein
MVAMSLWNMASHINALGMMHFIPGKFEHPKLLSPGVSINKNVVSLCQFVHYLYHFPLIVGAKLFLGIMKEATGIEMKPINPYQMFNFDSSSHYAFAGTWISDDSSNEEWV